MAFEPNRLSFDDGLNRIRGALKGAGVELMGRIVTSRDKDVRSALDALRVTNVPRGFRKWQLPVHLDGPAQLFLTAAEADADVPLHSHDDGNGIRFIVAGSIVYEGKELSAGDWMFVPKGKQYSFKVGPLGAVMCYCYQCCCA